jgi:hypothetical protein
VAGEASLGVGCEPPCFHDGRGVPVNARVETKQRVDGLVDVVRVEQAAEPHVEHGQETRLSHRERAGVFHVAGVVRPVNAGVVVMEFAVGAFSRGALRDVAAQGAYDQAAQGVPRRSVLSSSAGGGGRSFGLCGLPVLASDEGGDSAFDDDPGRFAAGTSLDTNRR